MESARDATRCAAYERCLQEAAAQSGKFLQRVIRRAAHQMRLQAGTPVGHDAAVALMHTQDRLCTLYQRAMIRSARTQAYVSAPGEHDDDQEVGRFREIATRMAQAELARLETLICAARGTAGADAGANPLRPTVHARCLHEALAGVPTPKPEVRAQWIVHLGLALGDELGPLYDVLARKLHGRGVRDEAPAPQLPPPVLLTASWAQSPM